MTRASCPIICCHPTLLRRYSRGESVVKTAEITVIDRDTRVKMIEEEIELLQEEELPQ